MIHLIIPAIVFYFFLCPEASAAQGGLAFTREFPAETTDAPSAISQRTSPGFDLRKLLVLKEDYRYPAVADDDAVFASADLLLAAQVDLPLSQEQGQDFEREKKVEADEAVQPGLEEKQGPATALPSGAEGEKAAADEQAKEAKISGDVFGRKKILLHPYLSLKQEYSDNIYNSGSNIISDAISTISPGIWFAFPSSKERLLEISTSSLTPGGLLLSREKARFPRKYQAYFFMGGDFERYSNNSDENADNFRIEGVLQYNMKSGISADLVNQFLTSQDARGTGVSSELDKYSTNLSSLLLGYEISDDFNVRADFSNYFVDYEATRNETRDRSDNSFSGYLFYKFKPKTSLFAEYDLIDISYDISPLRNSAENNFYAGIRMELTGKTRGELKTGYGIKDFADPDTKGVDKFILELKTEHAFSSKNLLKLAALRRINETSVSSADYTLTNQLLGSFEHKFSSNISGKLDFSYAIDLYAGDLTMGGETKALEDHMYSLSPALHYQFRKWLTANIAYRYSRRESSFASLNYINNTVLFNILFSI